MLQHQFRQTDLVLRAARRAEAAAELPGRPTVAPQPCSDSVCGIVLEFNERCMECYQSICCHTVGLRLPRAMHGLAKFCCMHVQTLQTNDWIRRRWDNNNAESINNLLEGHC